MAERKPRLNALLKLWSAHRAAVLFVLTVALLGIATVAWAQFASKNGDTVGTVGGACSSATNTYGWPDVNGNILKCVSNIWTLVTQPIAAAGSTGYVQFNSSGALAGSSNLFWDNTNFRLGIGTASPTQKLDIASTTGEVSARLLTNLASQNAIYFNDVTNGNDTAIYRPPNSRDCGYMVMEIASIS